MVLYDREGVDEEHEGPRAQLLDRELHRHPLRRAEPPHLLDKVGREGIELLAHPEEEVVLSVLLEDDRHPELLALISFRRVDDELLQGHAVRR